jgi:hypothetical protein
MSRIEGGSKKEVDGKGKTGVSQVNPTSEPDEDAEGKAQE